MLIKRSTKPQSAGSMVVAVVIALVSTAALLVFAASQSPGRTGSAAHRSRAAVNAAEESEIWASPKTDASQAQATQGDSTITGCLEQQGDRFRLKGANGADAPTSRSWKFGFLKRGPDPIDLVDAGTTTADHVGTRVRVTGILEDHRMHVRSLSRVADSCN
jgi:hypothetical protein